MKKKKKILLKDLSPELQEEIRRNRKIKREEEVYKSYYEAEAKEREREDIAEKVVDELERREKVETENEKEELSPEEIYNLMKKK
jgi:hypothetical protein